MAALILVFGVGMICLLIWKTDERILCNRCRYMVSGKRLGMKTNSCRIWGCPAEVEECKYFEEYDK